MTRSQLLGTKSLPGEKPVLTRHALHASRLALRHPKTGAMMDFFAPLAPDLEQVLEILQSSGLR